MNLMTNLAAMYWKSGKLHVARKLAEEVLLLNKRILKEHHHNTIYYTALLTAIFHSNGKFDAAQKLQLEEAVSLQQQ